MVMAWASLKLNDFGKFRLYMGATVLLGVRASWSSSTSSTRHKFHARPVPEHEHVPGDLLHADRAARAARHRRHGRERLLLGPGREALEARTPSSSPTGSRTPGLYWHFVDLVWIFLFPILYLL